MTRHERLVELLEEALFGAAMLTAEAVEEGKDDHVAFYAEVNRLVAAAYERAYNGV